MTRAGAKALGLLGESTILSLADAASVVPLRLSTSKKIAWMKARGIVHDFDGLECVILGDLLSALRGSAQSVPALAAPKAKDPWDELPRVTVGRK